jgi:hypothetical protein
MNENIKENTVQYNRRDFLKLVGVGASTLALGSVLSCKSSTSERLPNIVIIFTDDQDYSDLGCYARKILLHPI